VMYKILSFVQRWHVLLGGEDQSICSTLARPTRGWRSIQAWCEGDSSPGVAGAVSTNSWDSRRSPLS
jgi:hypothetical protein